MTKTAIARNDISPLIKKGSVLVRIGQYGILEGHAERKRIPVEVNGTIFTPPNFYPWEEIEKMKAWWKIIKS